MRPPLTHMSTDYAICKLACAVLVCRKSQFVSADYQKIQLCHWQWSASKYGREHRLQCWMSTCPCSLFCRASMNRKKIRKTIWKMTSKFHEISTFEIWEAFVAVVLRANCAAEPSGWRLWGNAVLFEVRDVEAEDAGVAEDVTLAPLDCVPSSYSWERGRMNETDTLWGPSHVSAITFWSSRCSELKMQFRILIKFHKLLLQFFLQNVLQILSIFTNITKLCRNSAQNWIIFWQICWQISTNLATYVDTCKLRFAYT